MKSQVLKSYHVYDSSHNLQLNVFAHSVQEVHSQYEGIVYHLLMNVSISDIEELLSSSGFTVFQRDYIVAVLRQHSECK